MKVIRIALIKTLFGILSTQCAALKCGINWVTEPCIGDTDSRYNPDASYNLKEQNQLWKSLEGLYVQDECDYDGTTGEEETSIFLSLMPKEMGMGSWSVCDVKGFMNITVNGSRAYFEKFSVMKNNADGVGGVQNPSLVYPYSFYASSTFEKNGQADSLSFALGYAPESRLDKTPPMLTPVGDRALLGLTTEDDGGGRLILFYCVDAECSKMNGYFENYELDDNGVRSVSRFTRSTGKKVKNKEAWMDEWSKTYADYNIPSRDEATLLFKNSYFTQPFDLGTSDATTECSTNCPNETEWQSYDPVFGNSPYAEPNGVLMGGFIALITILTVVVATTLFYVIYKRGMDAREKRVKEAVLKSIAETMSIQLSKNLTPAELSKMFEEIDVDGNGHLDKNEVKALVEKAGVTNMTDRDYQVLFNSIDIDHNGVLNFTEFCAFFASISCDLDTYRDSP